jgi:hypothetical protein
MTWALVPLGALLACNGDQNFNQLVPEITVSPGSVDFGEVVVDYTETAHLEVINTGRAPLTVELGFGDGGGPYRVEPSSFGLAAGERQELELSFTPPTYLEYPTELIFQSDDPDNPNLAIPVTGLGGDGPTPDIQLDTTTLDFGEPVAIGDAQTLWFNVSNVGDGDLHITDTQQTGSGAFSLPQDPSWSTLAAGSTTTVVVLYTPANLDGDHGSFVLSSDDPDEPEVTVQFLGNGGGDFEYPVAVIDGPSSVDPPETVSLDGSGSYDPAGFELVAYEWTLSKQPEGSAGELVATAGDSTEAFFDIAGRYEVQLVVENELGARSAPGKYTVDAIPEDAIHVEMFWDAPAADLDLHLLSSPSAELFDRPDDACYCNTNPDWGTSDSADDPRLDLDDIYGHGPENINIEEPADGEYPIRVHYFDDNGDGAVTSTVRVYLDGVLEEELSRVLERNEVWSAGRVRWPDAVLVEEDTVEANTGPRDCY